MGFFFSLCETSPSPPGVESGVVIEVCSLRAHFIRLVGVYDGSRRPEVQPVPAQLPHIPGGALASKLQHRVGVGLSEFELPNGAVRALIH